MSACRSCKAEVRWVLTEGGKKMPLDPLPTPEGNVLVAMVGGEEIATVLGPADRAAAQIAGTPLHISHFVTCPQAAEWREQPALFSDDMPVGQAREKLRELAMGDGYSCPVCTLFAKVYRHKCDSAMARTLIRMFRAGAASGPLHIPSLPGDNHKVSQLSWWALVEEEKLTRPDGGRAGYWRLTGKGVEFVLRQRMIVKYARIYDARVLGHVGELVSIDDCLGSKFNYAELMAA